MTTFNEKLPEAIDLSHHLSELSKRREQSPLKGLARYFGQPGLISLAGGMPAPDYFPLASLSAETLVPDSFATAPPAHSSSSLSWFWKLFGPHKERTEHLVVPKYSAAPPTDEVSLAVALQYGTATGLVPLNAFIQDFTKRVYQPQYSDFQTLIHAGNTDGWSKALQTLLNPGEMFLTEEWTYPSALATAKPLGVLPAPVKIDGEGMRADDLRKVLTEWDEKARGAPRPRLIYTVPVGQNPTGATMGATRKKDIYDICVEFDLLIVEDDPYYFLQEGVYVPRASRIKSANQASASVAKDDKDADAFITSLAPSFLKFDYQGRVVRLDSFSKTVAPGSRLGWFTCNKLFAERLERQGECSTQAPCGFGQAFVTQLLTKQWGFNGYVRWLRGLRAEYTIRRDVLIDAIHEEFAVSESYIAQGAWAGCTALVARPRTKDASCTASGECLADEKTAFGAKPLLSFVPPTAGMFIWVRVHFENHPAFMGAARDTKSLEEKLWTQLAEAGVLIGPGTYFAATPDIQAAVPLEGHFRIAFSNAEISTLKEAVRIMRKVFIEFFECE